MRRWFAGRPLSVRLWILLGLFSAAMIGAGLVQFSERLDRMRAERQLKTRHLVEAAHSILQHYHGLQQQGRLSQAEAQDAAMRMVRALRYADTEYFWIIDLERPVPKVLMHPTVPALEGTRPTGPEFEVATSRSVGLLGRFEPVPRRNLFAVMADVVEAGGHGFVTYDWPKPLPGGGVSDARYDKLSYVKRFEPWGWVVGSGLYIDDLDADFRQDVRERFAVDGALLLLVGLLAWSIGRSVLRPLATLQQTVDRLRQDPETPVELDASSHDELGRLIISFRELMQALQGSQRTARESMAQIQAIFDASPVVLAVLVDGRIVRVNRTFETMFGLPLASVQGQSLGTCFHDADACATFAAQLARLPGDGRQAVLSVPDVRFKRAGGPLFYANLFARPLDPARPGDGMLVVIEDIDDRRAAEAELRLWAKATAAMSEGVVITDADNAIVSVNQAFSTITGYTLDEVRGRTPALLRSGRHDTAFYQEMRSTLDSVGNWRGEVWNRDKHGSIYPEWLSISTLRGNDGQVSNYVAVFSDISERKAAESRIRFIAEHDALTGLPNRVLLYDRIEQATLKASRNGRLVAVLVIDLDRFKNINDSLGHDTGDELLREMARRIAACIRDSDTVSRQGGDEFIVLLPELEHQEDAARVAEKLIADIARPFDAGARVLATSASIGIAMYPGDGGDERALIRAADTAMYQSKDSGRNTYRFFTADMNTRVTERMSLEHELRGALARGELALHYQLQVAAGSGTVTGMEALLRWQHPELGAVSPVRFIPVAEDSGLILDIGAWVLLEACRQNCAWHRAGLSPVCVAVNVSAVQFRHAGFFASVRTALAQSGLPPHLLELELTESLMMSDAEQNIALLAELRAMGVKLSIDDFGTGYSSLSYLKRFPIDKLKIDRAFVRDLPAHRDDEAIVKAIIALAHTLGLRTIAEGVETDAQLRFLSDHGCDEIQGFLFCKPQAAAAIEALLRAGFGSPAPA